MVFNFVFSGFIMGPKPKNAKQVNLQVVQKLKLIRKLEQEGSVKNVCEVYGVKKQTVS